MEGFKICKGCGREFFKKNYLCNSRDSVAWLLRKFCSDECRLLYNKRNFKYELKKTYHDRQLIELNKNIKGNINVIQNRQDSENADIETIDANYEFELLHGADKFKKKYNRHKDNKKKHILIIGIHPKLREMFDEVYCYDVKKLDD